MKKTYTSILFLLVTFLSYSQIITTNPAILTQESGAIEVIFDASLGAGGLNNYAGTDVYAHTGVFTQGTSGWQHAPTWLDNSPKYKLVSMGNNKWKLSITPNMATYYNLSPTEKVTKLAFVFRNADGTREGKGTGNTDLFVDVVQTGLNLAFTNPTTDQAIAVGTNMNISFATTSPADLTLKINGNSVSTNTASTSLSYNYTFANTTEYTLIAEATANSITVRDTIEICVPAPIVNQAKPAGTIEGINYIDNTSATLVMYAPGKSSVFLIGEFNNWLQKNNYQLKKDGNYWWITLTGLTPGKIYGYQYLVDGVLRVSDAYSELILDPWNDKYINEKYAIYPNLKAYPIGKTDGLVATLQTAKTAYPWEVPTFTMPNRDNMVIYELLLRDFTVEKSLESAISKLDYLKNLGVTAIELMPIQEFDGNNSWGYNPNHFFATDKAYGTPETYKKFIDECHKRGMAVLLDVVFNHATGNNPFAKLYWNSVANKTASNNPWFNVDAPHPYSVFHDFNHSFNGTKEFFKRVLKFWIQEYKIDGFRLDLTKGFTQQSSSGEPGASNYDQTRINNLTDYYLAAKSQKEDVMFILEHFCDNSEETVLANAGMYLWRKANYEFSQAAKGFQTGSEFVGLNSTPQKWVGFAESHDEERNFYLAKIEGLGNMQTDSVARMKRVPLNIAFTTLMPGPKMIWQFGELGYDYSINSNGGRTNEKSSAWSYLNLAHRKAAYDASAKAISLKKLFHRAFTEGTYQLNVSTTDWNSGRRIALSHQDLNMVMLGNFNASATITGNPNFPKTGIWYNLLTGEELNVTNTAMTLSMTAGDLLIYTDRKVNLPNAITTPKSDINCTIYPTITSGKIFISTTSSVKKVVIYSIQGSILKAFSNITEIDLSTLSNGLYLVEVNTLEGKETYRVIKK